jgi:lipopolysaccharide transport protein LptA
MMPRSHRAAFALAFALLAICGLPRAAAGAEESSSRASVSPKAPMAIGVAPFEVRAPEAEAVPDVGALLADRLATKGVDRVVGPSALGATAHAEPSDAEVRAWAAGAQVQALVVGRATRVGRQLALDAHLRAGASGAKIGTYVAEAPGADDVAAAVDRLASQVVEGWSAAAGTPVAAAPPPAKTPKRLSPDATLSEAGFDRNAPININSAELEAIQEDGGRRRFVFSGKVKVAQDNVTLTSDRLEAFYPSGTSQPDRLVATGHVVVSQENKRANCDQATYLSAQQRIFCRGNAELRQGEDVAKGQEIELHLDTQRMFIKGGATIRIQPREQKQPAPPATVGGAG